MFCKECYRPRRFNEPSRVLDRPVSFERGGILGPDGSVATPESATCRTIMVDVQSVSRELLRVVQSNPAVMRKLSARQFEELVAEMFSRSGYTVQLTPETRDGGFDIAAAKKDGIGKFLYLVECKRYTPPSKVGVQVVRSLYGVVENSRANGGIVVTSSFFTGPAHKEQQQMRNRMSLCDYVSMQKWLTQTE